MSFEEMQTLVASLSAEEKQLLKRLLHTGDADVQDEWEAFNESNPLRGTVGHYEAPFEPAVPIADWEVLRDSA